MCDGKPLLCDVICVECKANAHFVCLKGFDQLQVEQDLIWDFLLGINDVGKVSKTLEEVKEVKEVLELVDGKPEEKRALMCAETPFVICLLIRYPQIFGEM